MILSRYFNKSDYGTYKQVLYVYNTFLFLFTLGIPKAFSYFLPRVPNDQAKSLIRKITYLFFLLGGVFSLLLFLCAGIAADFLKNPDLVGAIRIFAIVPFLMMPTMGLEGILATFKQTKFMALYTVSTRIVMLCCVALPVMIFGFGYKEALIGFVVGSFFSCILALILKFRPVRKYGNENCSVTFKDIFKFSMPLLYASVWGVIIRSSDQFFISRYYGNEVFADFSNGSFELPFVGMVVSACAAVLSPIFSKMNYEKVDFKKEVYPLWVSVFKKTAMLIYPLVIFSMVFAYEIMDVLYGSQYLSSGYYFRVKLITNFFTLIVYAPLIINTGHVKFYSRVHMITAISIVVLEYISVLSIKTPYAISWISMLCHIGIIFAMLLLAAKIFGVKFHELFPIKVLMQILIPSALLLLLEHWIIFDVLKMNMLVGLIVGFGVYATVFYLYSLVIKLNYFNIIKPLFSKK